MTRDWPVLMAEELPEVFSDIDKLINSLDRIFEELPDETCKARWCGGRPRLEKLIEAVKRKAGGLQLDS